MIDAYFNGKLAGSGMALWEARRMAPDGGVCWPGGIRAVVAGHVVDAG